MSSSAATPPVGTPTVGMPDTGDAVRQVAALWWLWLVVGIAWIAVSLVVLQFDEASIKTIGVIVGIMFIVAGVQQLVLAAVADSLRWLWAIFGVVFLARRRRLLHQPRGDVRRPRRHPRLPAS